MRVACVVLVLCVTASCGTQDEGELEQETTGEPGLELVERQVWAVLDAQSLSSGVILSGGRALVAGRAGLLRFDKDRAEPLLIVGDTSLVLAAQPSSAPDDAYLVDQASGRVARYVGTGSGIHPKAWDCMHLAGLRGAARTRDGLVASLPGQEDQGLVVVSVSLPPESKNCELAAEPSAPLHLTGASLLVVDGEIILSPSDPTQPIMRSTARQSRHAFEELPASVPPAFREAGGERRLPQRAMPLMPTDSGYLRVVADITSDGRRFEFYDYELRHTKTSRIDAPIGFVAADRASQLLLGMRGRGSPELVLYGWAWN